MTADDLVWRAAQTTDSPAVIAAITDWWPGVHMVHAVNPQRFEHFGDTCIVVEEDGRPVVFAETGAWNTKSIAFHERVGFVLRSGGEVGHGVPVHRDTTGHGFDYVEMVWRLAGESGK